MKANKIVLNNEVLIDLTADTVTQNDVKKGVTFHGRDGVEYEGTYEVALQDKRVTPTKEIQEVTPDADYEGLSKVTVEAIPEEYVVPSGSKTITTNDTHPVAGLAEVEVAVPVPKIDKITSLITKNGPYKASDFGLDGISSFSVNVVGGGSGECSGTHVIEVDTLPTKGVAGAIYKTSDVILNDILLRVNSSGETGSFLELLNILLGTAFHIRHVDSYDDLPATLPEDSLPLYFVKSECMLYVGETSDGTIQWTAIPDGTVDGDVTVVYELAPGTVYYEWISSDYRDEFRDVIIVKGAYLVSARHLFEGNGVDEYSFNVIPTQTTEGIKVSVDDTAIHIYYIEDDNDLFVYGDPDDSGTNKWLSVSQYASDEELVDLPFNGFVNHAGEAVKEGLYVVGTAPGWKRYFRPVGTIYTSNITSEVDVTDYATVRVMVPEYTGKVVYE